VTAQHHVLLIGIDAYQGGGSLTGCVNDIDAIQQLLIGRVGISPSRITRLAAPRFNTQHPTDVSEQLPTLENIRAALARLGSDAVAPGDRVLIYYSGHGTQCIVTDGTKRFSREALLPTDKLVANQHRFLFDWELNLALASIVARRARTTMVLDCCSSGGATRGADNGADRFWRTETDQVVTDPGPSGNLGHGLVGRVDDCQVIAACRDDQRARESAVEGTSNGELTRALVRQLAAIPSQDLLELHWGRIWRAVEAGVREANSLQSPWLSGSFGRRVFGFGVDEDGDRGFTTVQVPGGFELDVGRLHGVTEGAMIGVYGSLPQKFPPLQSEADDQARQGALRVTEAANATAKAVAVAPFVFPDAARGRLVVAGGPARLRVQVVPEDASVAAQLRTSGLLELVTCEHDVAFVRRRDGDWAVTDAIHGTGEVEGEPVLAVVPKARLDAARDVLEHYHAYITPLRIALACQDLPTLLRLSILNCAGPRLDPATAQDPPLPPVASGSRAPYEVFAGDLVCFVVENTAEVTLRVTLLDCAASGRVQVLGEKALPARTKHVFWAGATLASPFRVSLTDARRAGVDRLVAIGATSTTASLAYLANRTSFAELLARTRGMRGSVARGGVPELWTSATTALRINAH
jgi:Caspase domain